MINLKGIPTEPIWFATSMHSQAELHPGTFNFALQQLQLELDNPYVTYVSFLNTIKGPHIHYQDPYLNGSKKLDMNHVITNRRLNKSSHFLLNPL